MNEPNLVRTDEIPEVDTSMVPLIVEDGSDWRAVANELRERYPFFRVTGNPGIWFTRYEAARDLYMKHELFTNKKERYQIPGSEEPPRLNQLRRALQPWYGPAQVKRWEDRMQTLARELILRFSDKGECEFVRDFAYYFFPYIGAEMLGAPREDWELLARLEDALFKLPSGLKVSDLRHMLQRNSDADTELIEYLDDLVVRKRSDPGDDFISFVQTVEFEGKRFTDLEVRAAVHHFILGASHTVGAHLAYVFKEFAETDKLRARVVADPTYVNTAGEEILRLYPLWGFPRWAKQDIDFHGVQLEQGDMAFSLLTMANRDPRVSGFDRVDYERHPNRHLGFMVGVHQCLGMHWARTSRRIAVTEWHRLIPDYQLKEPPRIEQPFLGVGWHTLPLVWDTARRSARAA